MRLLNRLRERELFRTHTAWAYPVGAVHIDRDGQQFKVTRHRGPYAGTIIVYGVAHEEETSGT